MIWCYVMWFDLTWYMYQTRGWSQQLGRQDLCCHWCFGRAWCCYSTSFGASGSDLQWDDMSWDWDGFGTRGNSQFGENCSKIRVLDHHLCFLPASLWVYSIHNLGKCFSSRWKSCFWVRGGWRNWRRWRPTNSPAVSNKFNTCAACMMLYVAYRLETMEIIIIYHYIII